MKVIVVNYRYFVAGGPEKYMFKFMEAAKKRGIEIIPFSVKNPRNESTIYSEYFANPRADALDYADTKMTLKNLFGIFRATVWNYDAEKKLRKLIRDTKPDAIYVLHEINHLSPSVIRAATKENVKVVHRISDFFMFCPKYDFLCENNICESCLHGNYSKAIKMKCVKNSKSGTILRVIAMKLYSFLKIFDEVDKYICTCEFSKQKLIQGGIKSDKISCVPTFIDSSKIKPNYDHDKYFLFLGRMAHQKGVIYAVEAMKYLKDTEYVLKITGDIADSPYDREILKCIKDNQLEDKIIFTGFKQGKELDNIISMSTCVLCPSIWYENMPNTVIESYAYGKPVVASNIGSLAEIVIDGETGFLFEIKNSKDLADKLNKFINDDRLSGRLGKNSRIRCENIYSVDNHMNKVISILKS